MRAAYLIAFMLGGLLAATSAPAREPVAQLKRIQGSVLVNTGDSYQSASEGMALYLGDRVMSLDKSSMVLVYSDGCVAEFEENQIISVADVSTCESGAAYVERKWPQEADPMFTETRRPPQGAYGYKYGYEGPADYSTLYTIGGVAAVGGLIYYVAEDISGQ